MKKVGLYVDGDIGRYYSKDSDTPFLIDRRFIVGCDTVHLQRSRINGGTSGLRIDQEFSVHWEKTPVITFDGVSTVLKRLIMRERNIPDELLRRCVTKFVDSNKRNMLSSNIVLAEVISVCRSRERYQYNSRLAGTVVRIDKGDLLKMFKEHCELISHPLVLSLDGILIDRKDC